MLLTRIYMIGFAVTQFVQVEFSRMVLQITDFLISPTNKPNDHVR